MLKVHPILMMIFLLITQAAGASQFTAQGRVFVGTTSANPSNLNQEMAAQGLKDFKSITRYGVEITTPVANYLDVGLRYTKISSNDLEINPTPNMNYHALLDQDSVALVARVPILKTEFFKVDAFGAIGGSNTGLTVKTATQDGDLSRRDTKGWLATMNSSAGVSAAAGYKNFYVYLEAGYESNKVDSFQRSGNLNNNIQTIDLSGSTFTIGLLFNGVTATSK